MRKTESNIIGTLSRAINIPSFAVSGPLNPSLSSATRYPLRISKQSEESKETVEVKIISDTSHKINDSTLTYNRNILLFDLP